MTRQKGTLLLAAVLVAGISATANAQQPPQHGGGGRPAAAPAARPAAPHFAPAPRMAAPQMSAPRMSAPRMAAPQMAPRMAQPRMQPNIRANMQPRMATPHVNAPRMATPNIQRPPTVNRTVQRQQFRQERALRQQQQPSAQARSQAQSQHVQMYRRRRNSCRQIRRPIHVTSCGRHVTSCVPSAHCVEPRRANCVGFQRRNARQSASRSIKRVNSVPSPDSSSRSPTQHRRTRTRATGVRTAAMEWRA